VAVKDHGFVGEALPSVWSALPVAILPGIAIGQADGVAGPVIAVMVAQHSILPLAGWLAALLPLRGPATVLKALIGAMGCLLAAVGTSLLLTLFRQVTFATLTAALLLPALCLVAHLVRAVRALRSRRPASPGTARGFFRDLWRSL
jgi:hypothetical protein